ncbi:carbohydrate esterase family 16 protein [Hypoxylon fragiforme]|uniref:carbohydrate esterase family 16 protein n=1 Tax=Hypoxylon fragiforme TaxID=63214 RepID=UPI0020C71EBB|nr:carbohydrate esterase family 16 protein [Hypoxylon fragiforme]KAI2605282.1 carbohydrate esterase family 16 protein [Hypoxylon fragiforme]
MRFPTLLVVIFASITGRCCGYRPAKIDNLIVFGDSYSDEGRLAYFFAHNNTAPPVGLYIPESNVTASGGKSWPQLASKKLGATTFNYAVTGAVCTDIFPDTLPSVKEYEVEAFAADTSYVNPATGNNTLYKNRQPDNTVYTLWIGANDLGVGGFLTDSQEPAGSTISDLIECVWPTFDLIYKLGGRRFVLFTEVPLNLAPLYRTPEHGGSGDVPRWPDKLAHNTTEYEQKILEYTTLVNKIFAYGVPLQQYVQRRWPGSEFSLFDTHQLIEDIYAAPNKYLDAPANATGYYAQCANPMDIAHTDCTFSSNPLSSFLWFDELHLSPKAHEYIATEFVNVLNRTSKYGLYY